MAADGKLVDRVLATNSLDYPLGKGTPLEHLCEENGKVLLLGSDLDHVTLLYYAEALAPIENKRLAHIKAPLNIDGYRSWVDIVEFDSNIGIRIWEDRFFAHIMERFIDAGKTSQGTIGVARSYLSNARELVQFAIPIMVEAAALAPESTYRLARRRGEQLELR